MPQYDFRTLSPIDFEGLVRDLLQKELGVTLESFMSGRDSGIDFRYCPDRTRTVVIQCKHFVESGYDLLYSHLKTKELAKVKALRPSRYILATSVGLTPRRKKEIVKLFSPLIKRPADVLGKDDINNLLGKHPEVERHTLKLWLSSLPILEEVLHSRIHNFSKSELRRIQERAKLYVQNESFVQAMAILKEYNFCIISGIPGIGKTILAQMLVMHYARTKYDVVKVSEDISEAWAVGQPDRKKVFYYDDFLGQTSFSEKLHKNEDQRLIDFIHALRYSNGSKLIMTTREYILKQARQQYERLDREGFDSQKCIVDLARYTRLNRARILYNHIYFSELPREYSENLLAKRSFLKIIDHPNYSPRIVQLVTERAVKREIDPGRFVDFFLSNMNNPLQIWDVAFRRHLSQQARNLLIVLASLPHQVFLRDLERAFVSYNGVFAEDYHTVIGPQDFTTALKELDGDFLTLERDAEDNLVRYQNPSVTDFVREYLKSSKQEMSVLSKALVYFEQFELLWRWPEQVGREALTQIFRARPEFSVSLMRKLLSAETCRLIVHRASSGLLRRRWPVSLEERAATLAGLISGSLDLFLPLLRETVEGVSVCLAEGHGDIDGVAELMKQCSLLNERSEKWLSEFVNAAKLFLMESPSWGYELRPLCRLLRERPELFSPDDMEQIQELVKEVAANVTSSSSDDDPDTLRDEAEALETMASAAGVDIDDAISDIRQMAHEAEKARGEESDEPEYDLGVYKSNPHTGDEEIASLFSTLSVME